MRTALVVLVAAFATGCAAPGRDTSHCQFAADMKDPVPAGLYALCKLIAKHGVKP